MKVEFVRFKASDGVELQGLLKEGTSDTAVLHIHGRSGNGYENRFLDHLRELYAAKDISFFTIDTRGMGVISSFAQGDGTKLAGSCYEIFEESVHDIQGALDYLRSIGKRKFILQGHSLGCTKAVHYMLEKHPDDIEKIILLAPTDLTGWAESHPEHQEYLARAKQLLSEGKGEEFVAAKCWLDETPASAQSYPTICEAGSPADIYGDREGGALLGRLELPVFIPYGTKDIGIEKIDGSMDVWLERVNKIKHDNTRIAVIEGAGHGFRGYEEELTGLVREFIG